MRPATFWRYWHHSLHRTQLTATPAGNPVPALPLSQHLVAQRARCLCAPPRALLTAFGLYFPTSHMKSRKAEEEAQVVVGGIAGRKLLLKENKISQ